APRGVRRRPGGSPHARAARRPARRRRGGPCGGARGDLCARAARRSGPSGGESLGAPRRARRRGRACGRGRPRAGALPRRLPRALGVHGHHRDRQSRVRGGVVGRGPAGPLGGPGVAARHARRRRGERSRHRLDHPLGGRAVRGGGASGGGGPAGGCGRGDLHPRPARLAAHRDRPGRQRLPPAPVRAGGRGPARGAREPGALDPERPRRLLLATPRGPELVVAVPAPRGRFPANEANYWVLVREPTAVAYATARAVQRAVWLGAAALVAGVILAVWWLARWLEARVAAPVRTAGAVAARVARGDLTVGAAARESGTDETGALLASVDTMVAALRRLVGAIRATADEAAAMAAQISAATE